jgi:hypothetical protein
MQLHTPVGAGHCSALRKHARAAAHPCPMQTAWHTKAARHNTPAHHNGGVCQPARPFRRKVTCAPPPPSLTLSRNDSLTHSTLTHSLSASQAAHSVANDLGRAVAAPQGDAHLGGLLVEPLLMPLPSVVHDVAWAMSTQKVSTLVLLMISGGSPSRPARCSWVDLEFCGPVLRRCSRHGRRIWRARGSGVHFEGLERAWPMVLLGVTYDLAQLRGLAQALACSQVAGSTSTMPRHQQPTDAAYPDMRAFRNTMAVL